MIECLLYVHGTCNGIPARRHRITGEVQFVLWKAGQQGHQKDYWQNFNSFWWPDFKVTPKHKP